MVERVLANLICNAVRHNGEDVTVTLGAEPIEDGVVLSCADGDPTSIKISLPEGDEKPSKYPALFTRADLVLINKIDLGPVLNYSLERVRSDCQKLKSGITILEVSASTSQGLEPWTQYLLGTS